MKESIDLKVIKQAILNEVEGYEFYRLYADKVSDEGVRSIFLKIAAEERMHIEFLNKLAGPDEEDQLSLASLEIPAPGIFRFTSLTPESLSLAVSAFAIAMKMEEDSQRFYDEAASRANNETEKHLYEVLRDWEISHRDAFARQYEELREAWWNDNSFAPF